MTLGHCGLRYLDGCLSIIKRPEVDICFNIFKSGSLIYSVRILDERHNPPVGELLGRKKYYS